jgi:non-specific serine/threonine protein kinase
MSKFELRNITKNVQTQIIQRAYGYVLNKIQIVRKQPALIAAKAMGTRTYDTIISQNDYGEYIQSCTCPYGAPCKHTVALAMQISTQSSLVQLIEMSPQTLFTTGKNHHKVEIKPTSTAPQINIGIPVPQLVLSSIRKAHWHSRLMMRYEEASIEANFLEPIYLPGLNGKICKRNFDMESIFAQYFYHNYPGKVLDWDEFNQLVLTLPQEWEILIEKDELTKIYRGDIEAKFENESGINWLDITGEIQIDETKYTLAEMILAGAGQNRIVTLRGKSHLIDEPLFKKFQKLATLADKSGAIKLKRSQIGIVNDLEMLDLNKLHVSWQKTLKAVRDFEGVTEIAQVAGLNANLRPYQLHGVSYLNYLQELEFGGILADDMGLGKTVQAIAMLSKYKIDNPKMKILIVSPTSVVSNWQSEIQRFAPNMKTYVYAGLRRVLPSNIEILLTSYAIVRRDVELLKKIKWDYLILDEAQYTKNFASLTARATRSIDAKHRLCLTGTPIENNLSELYSQLEFLNPGMLGTLKEFRENIAGPIEKHQNVEISAHLQKLIKPFILRRTKDQVLTELPPKTEQIISLEMGIKQKAFYETLRQYYQTRILKMVDQRGIGQSKLQILEALLRLRQTCCDPRLVKLDDDSGSIKLNEVVKICKELIEEGHKVLLFSQFTTMLDLIEKEFEKNNILYKKLTGQTKSAVRTKLIDSFQIDGNPQVFLLSLKAGGIGINLTAADYVIHYDPWWNPAVESQATDRTHRIGQNRAVTVYKMVIKDSIEEKILGLQQKKKDLIDRVILGGKVSKELSREDLEYLLG